VKVFEVFPCASAELKVHSTIRYLVPTAYCPLPTAHCPLI